MKYWFVLLFVLFYNSSLGQTCLHTGLSKKFDYKITKTGKKDSDGFIRLSGMTIEIYNKIDRKLFQKLEFSSEGYLPDTFSDCANERSFITGKNKNAEVGDNDYGDIVVVDLNFDSKEDFAIKYNIPVDVGPEYWYFVQTEHGFEKDKYLSDNMPFFPSIIKPGKHTLVSIVSPNAGTNIYQLKYNVATKKWRTIAHRFIYHDIGLEATLKKLNK